MIALIGRTHVEVIVGNLITEEADAIVNPAQKGLHPGGGVDGEIHLWGGPQIWQECRELGGCDTGEARITGGGNLRAKFVIHTVGPIWTGGEAGEAAMLSSCYRRCLEIATERNLASIAFPAISTGHYGYPLEQAASIAVTTVADYLRTHRTSLQTVRFVVRGRAAFDAFDAALSSG